MSLNFNAICIFTCSMRKCLNPRLSINAINQENSAKAPQVVSTGAPSPTTVKTPTVVKSTNIGKTLSSATSPATVKDTRKVPILSIKVPEEKIEPLQPPEEDTGNKIQQQEKGVFIPRQMTRMQPDQKVGKKEWRKGCVIISISVTLITKHLS